MSLYIRVQNNFWTHRKTMRLKARLGDDAFWIVPRLWSIAAEHQADGDFSSYTSGELAMLIGCDKHATSIKEALISAGFMEESGELHDWGEHNGYHASFAERAKTAADARWGKKDKRRKDKTRKERKGKETSIASSMLVAWRESFDVYLDDCKTTLCQLQNDTQFIDTQQRFNPNVDIRLSMDKAFTNFWGTEAGWKHKKKSKITDIDWKSTFTKAIDMNKVWKPKTAPSVTIDYSEGPL